MPNYTLRIQLLGNHTEPVYEDLHARMKAGGLGRTITGFDDSGRGCPASPCHGRDCLTPRGDRLEATDSCRRCPTASGAALDRYPLRS